MAISIKGIIVGWLSSLLATMILALPLGYSLAAVFGPEQAQQLIGPISVPILMLTMVTAVIGGYVAATVAGDGELLNGSLAILFGCLIATLVGDDSPEALTSDIMRVFILPLFGLLGGYIRLRQVAERT
jgi:hypothetical protein